MADSLIKQSFSMVAVILKEAILSRILWIPKKGVTHIRHILFYNMQAKSIHYLEHASRLRSCI